VEYQPPLCSNADYARWRYTGITRAKDTLKVWFK
jgi:hypothetical protein